MLQHQTLSTWPLSNVEKNCRNTLFTKCVQPASSPKIEFAFHFSLRHHVGGGFLTIDIVVATKERKQRQLHCRLPWIVRWKPQYNYNHAENVDIVTSCK